METLSRLNKEILNPLAKGNYGVLDNIDLSSCTIDEREFYMNVSTILNNNLLMLNNNDK